MERLADPANLRATTPTTAWQRISAAEPQARSARPAQGARRLARDRGAGQEHPARPDHARTRRSPTSPATRPRSRPIWPRCAGSRPAWRNNDIGGRLMAALANGAAAGRRAAGARRAPGWQGRRAGRRPAQAAAQDRAARSTSPPGCSRAPTSSSRSPRASARLRSSRLALRLFGRDALDLVEGRLAFAVDGGKLRDDPDGGRRMRIAGPCRASGIRMRDRPARPRPKARGNCDAVGKRWAVVGQAQSAKTRAEALGSAAPDRRAGSLRVVR